MQKQLTAQLTTYQAENIALLKEFGSKSAEETMRETIAPMLAACGFDEFGVSSRLSSSRLIANLSWPFP